MTKMILSPASMAVLSNDGGDTVKAALKVKAQEMIQQIESSTYFSSADITLNDMILELWRVDGNQLVNTQEANNLSEIKLWYDSDLDLYLFQCALIVALRTDADITDPRKKILINNLLRDFETAIPKDQVVQCSTNSGEYKRCIARTKKQYHDRTRLLFCTFNQVVLTPAKVEDAQLPNLNSIDF